MRAGIVAATLAACAPASADPASFRVGLLCSGTMPVAIVIESSRPGLIAIDIGDVFGACVAALKESHQWQGGS
jgi:NCAIR mutase (PurE)-related protein